MAIENKVVLLYIIVINFYIFKQFITIIKIEIKWLDYVVLLYIINKAHY